MKSNFSFCVAWIFLLFASLHSVSSTTHSLYVSERLRVVRRIILFSSSMQEAIDFVKYKVAYNDELRSQIRFLKTSNLADEKDFDFDGAGDLKDIVFGYLGSLPETIISDKDQNMAGQLSQEDFASIRASVNPDLASDHIRSNQFLCATHLSYIRPTLHRILRLFDSNHRKDFSEELIPVVITAKYLKKVLEAIKLIKKQYSVMKAVKSKLSQIDDRFDRKTLLDELTVEKYNLFLRVEALRVLFLTAGKSYVYEPYSLEEYELFEGVVDLDEDRFYYGENIKESASELEAKLKFHYYKW